MSSGGLVLKPMEKQLFASSRAMCKYSAPVLSCCRCNAVNSNSGTCLTRLRVKPWSCSPTCGKLEMSVTAAYPRVMIRAGRRIFDRIARVLWSCSRAVRSIFEMRWKFSYEQRGKYQKSRSIHDIVASHPDWSVHATTRLDYSGKMPITKLQSRCTACKCCNHVLHMGELI